MATKKTEITESDLKKLGFKKVKVPSTSSYPDPPYYYYTYDLYKHSVISLITNDSEHAFRNGWEVVFFQEERFKTKDLPTLNKLMDCLEGIKSIIKSKKTK